MPVAALLSSSRMLLVSHACRQAHAIKSSVRIRFLPLTSSLTTTTTASALATASPEDHLKVFKLIRAYKDVGHLAADTEPLKFALKDPYRSPLQFDQVDALQPRTYGIDDASNKNVYVVGDEVPGLVGTHSLDDIIAQLRRLYCGKLGIEYTHIVGVLRKAWLEEKLCGIVAETWRDADRKALFERVVHAGTFEKYLGGRFSTSKRFSLEGAETIIPGLEYLLAQASKLGVRACEMGMAHRGRLNVIHNVLGVPLRHILDDFNESVDTNRISFDDQRIHLGTSCVRRFPGCDKKMQVLLAANPSHLEAVNGVVLGKTRARQFLLRGHEGGDVRQGPLGRIGSVDYSPSDRAKESVMALLVHGDASLFQGSVSEIMGFSGLRDYTTGGTVHIVVNNQIGFTTTPKEATSSMYCTDIAKHLGVPIFHANGDCPEMVVRACELAAQYRQRFSRDAVVNVWCYRAKGHNEQDIPELTQPFMYTYINSQSAAFEKYGQTLVDDGVMTQDEVEETVQDILDGYILRGGFGRGTSPSAKFTRQWSEVGEEEKELPGEQLASAATGVAADALVTMSEKLFVLPDEGFAAHPHVIEVMKKRLDSIISGAGIQWATAEALAFGTLLVEGFHIRLSGQDVERGTFNQRHAVIYDQDPSRAIDGDERIYKPWTALQSLYDAQKVVNGSADACSGMDGKSFKESSLPYKDRVRLPSHERFGAWGEEISRRRKGMMPSLGVMEVCNSPLSEEGVLAFEHGYSIYSPHILTIWEAQFGDFANCAQTIIDTFIATGEKKWIRKCGLIMLLPHGLEGAGPDHSSSRVERFLQLTNEIDDYAESKTRTEHEAKVAANMFLIQCSTPAQYFHALRRHMLHPYRKPMVMFTPKHLLHHKPCSSTLAELSEGTSFRPILVDDANGDDPAACRTVVLCSGKVYYQATRGRKARGISAADAAVVRVEQLCPFPFDEIAEVLDTFSNATKVVWLQEEPKNAGAYTWVAPRLQGMLHPRGLALEYVGRAVSTGATGVYKQHVMENASMMKSLWGDN